MAVYMLVVNIIGFCISGSMLTIYIFSLKDKINKYIKLILWEVIFFVILMNVTVWANVISWRI